MAGSMGTVRPMSWEVMAVPYTLPTMRLDCVVACTSARSGTRRADSVRVERMSARIHIAHLSRCAAARVTRRRFTAGRILSRGRLGIEKVVHHRDDDGDALHQRDVCRVGQDGQSRCGARPQVAENL